MYHQWWGGSAPTNGLYALHRCIRCSYNYEVCMNPTLNGSSTRQVRGYTVHCTLHRRRRQTGSVEAVLCCAKCSENFLQMMILPRVVQWQIFEKCTPLDCKRKFFSMVYNILAPFSHIYDTNLSSFPGDRPALRHLQQWSMLIWPKYISLGLY